jgi:hypothetical protein
MPFVEEENAVRDIAAAREGAQCGRAVESAENSGAAVAAEGPRAAARVWLAVGPEQRPGHRAQALNPVA